MFDLEIKTWGHYFDGKETLDLYWFRCGCALKIGRPLIIPLVLALVPIWEIRMATASACSKEHLSSLWKEIDGAARGNGSSQMSAEHQSVEFWR